MNNPEALKSKNEISPELREMARERAAELQKSRDNLAEKEPQDGAERLEKARIEAISRAESRHQPIEMAHESHAHQIHRVTKADKNTKYKQTLRHAQDEMSLPSRAFSKIIHSPVVEKTSDIVGSTVARPNAILTGSFSALLLSALVYGVARIYGYQLSGFETIGAFAVGWLIGILYDYLKVLFTGRR